jgi:hypothetical protein
MQILIHIPIFQGILGRLIRTSNRGIEMLQMARKANSNLEWIHSALQRCISVAAIGDRDMILAERRYLWLIFDFEGTAGGGLQLRGRVVEYRRL